MGTAIKQPVPDWVKLVDRHPGTLTLSLERQSAWMSKIVNEYGLTWSGTGCFIAVPIWQLWASRVKRPMMQA